jgi:hypothetical protein
MLRGLIAGSAIFCVIGLLLMPGFATSTTQGRPTPSVGAPDGSAESPTQASLSSASDSLARGLGPARGQSWSCSSAGPGSGANCGPERLTSASSVSGANWQPIGYAPPSDKVGTLVYDSADNYTVLIQYPSSGANGPEDTWTYAAGVWTHLNLTTEPGACPETAVAYDAADRYILFLGGFNCSSAGQTWKFSAGVWTQIFPSPAPPYGEGESLAYDPSQGYLLLFGGFNASSCFRWGCNGTWSYVHGSWTNLTPTLSTLPPARVGASLVYDAADGYMLMFGGSGWSDANNSPLSFTDSWSFNGTNWTEILGSGGPAHPDQVPASATYDPRLGEVVAFEGDTEAQCSTCNQTWVYHAGTWTNVSRGSDAPSIGLWSLSFDPGSNRTIAFGFAFADYYTSAHGALWTFSGTSWTELTGGFGPPSTYFGMMAYDAADGYVVLFGGCTPFGDIQYSCVSNDTWTYRGGIWHNITSSRAPSGRNQAGMVYDAADGYILLFGGLTQPTASATLPVNDTWEFLNGTWSQLSPVHSPPPTVQPDLVYDAADGYVLLVGGSWTWTFSRGLWTNITSSVKSAPTRPSSSIAYDAADGYVVLFGNYSPTDPASDTSLWTYFAGTWTDRSSSGPLPGTPPVTQYGLPLVYDSSRSAIEMYSDWGNGTVFEYSGGAWSSVVPVVSPPAVEDEAMAFDAADGYLLMFGGAVLGAPGGTLYDATWAWVNTSGPGPLAISSVSASPNPVDVGATTAITPAVLGGVGSYSYAYSGLPPGCGSANTSVLNCTPTQAGLYTVDVTVSDPSGTRAGKTLLLDVTDAPTVVSFVASPSAIVLGNRTILTTTGTGGAGPLTYQYSGLPPGCTTQDVPALPCTPTGNGTFSPSVVVSDNEVSSPAASTPLSVGCDGLSVGPQICQFSALPAAIVLGNNTSLRVVAYNASLNVSYSYSGLPAGCVTSNSSMIVCAPTVSGVYTPKVTVADAGGSTSSTTVLTVFPVGGGTGVVILAFSALPNHVSVGNPTVLQLLVNGGTGTYTYAYAGLPSSCASENAPSLSCTPSAPGVYRTYAVVSDNASSRVGAFLTLYVSGKTVVPGPGPGTTVQGLSAELVGAAFVGGVLIAGLLIAAYRRRQATRAEADEIVRSLSETGVPDPPRRE